MTYLAKTTDGLLPCPHCGGEAELVRNSSGSYFVRCTNRQCAAKTRLYHENEVGARMAWNKRAEPTCHIVSMDMAGNPPYRKGNVIYDALSDGCSECGYPFDTMNNGVPAHCHNCGARVTDE